jgi:predicted dehydrogenase
VLFDLGPHLIDQALDLLGPARSVYAEVRRLRPGARVDDDVFLAIEHVSGVLSQLSATMLAAQPGPRFRALGSHAAYVKWGLDVQEEALRSGARPGDPGFGEDPREAWGLLGTEDDAAPVETARGRYVDFYEQMERAIRAREAAGAPTPAAPPGEPAPAAPPGEPAPAAPAGEPAPPGVPPPVPLEAGIATLRVIEAARASAAERVVVPL